MYPYVYVCLCIGVCVCARMVNIYVYVFVCICLYICVCLCVIPGLQECRGSFYTSCEAGSRTKSLVLRAEQIVLRAQGGRRQTSEINDTPFDSKDSEVDWGGQHPLPKCEDHVIAS